MSRQWKRIKRKMLAAGLAVTIGASMAPQVSIMAAVSAEEVKGLKEGLYSGSANVYQYNYDITAKVRLAGGKITEITLTDESYTNSEPSESYNYLENAANGIKRKNIKGVIDQILEKQSTENIDAISNATYSSKAIVSAVENALAEAKKASDTEKGDKEIEEESVGAGISDKGSGTSEIENGSRGNEIPKDANREEKGIYALMNIPFSDFYAEETPVKEEILPVSSATKQKTRSTSLASGSYHVDAGGSDITGIIYPVKIPEGTDLSGFTQVTDESSVSISIQMKGKETTTTLKGKDALFESPSYSYYLLSEAPAYYKEMSRQNGAVTFKRTTAPVKTIKGVTSSFKSRSRYGDYQLNLMSKEFFDSVKTVYGVVINTTDGKGYGLRQVENIWRKSELAWGAGFTKTAHGNLIADSPYRQMMGKTIEGITYYTDAGVFYLDIDDIYVAIKTGAEADVENAKAGDGSVRFKVKDLPQDFAAAYEVEGLDASIENNTISYKNAEPGLYELEISDKNKKYDSIFASFVLETDNPAEYNQDKMGLAVKAGFHKEDLDKYVKAISKVIVDGKEYSAKGKHAVKIVKEDGSIDLTSAAFAEPKESYEMTINATAYPDLSFTLLKERQEPAYLLIRSRTPKEISMLPEDMADNSLSVDGSLILEFDAPYAAYTGIKLEKEGSGLLNITDTDYHVSEGSTILTFNPDFVAAFQEGEYTLTAEFAKDRSVKAKFRVNKKENEGSKEETKSPVVEENDEKISTDLNQADSSTKEDSLMGGDGKAVNEKKKNTENTGKDSPIKTGKDISKAGNQTAKGNTISEGGKESNKHSLGKAAKTGDEGPFMDVFLLGISFAGIIVVVRKKMSNRRFV